MQSNREKILEVAEKLFGEKGFKAVSVREITQKAQVNVSAVNYYFGSKKGLYLAVFKELWLKRAYLQRQYLQKNLEAKKPLDIQTFVQEVITSFLTGPICEDIKKYHHALIQREFREPSEALDMVLKEAIHPMLNLLSNYLETIFPSRFSEEEKKVYALSIIGVAVHFNLVSKSLPHILPEIKTEPIPFIGEKISFLLAQGLQGITK